MSGLTAMAALGVALLLGMVCGVKLEESAWRRAEKAAKQIDAIRRTPGRRRSSADAGMGTPVSAGGITAEKPQKKRLTASKLIALWMLGLTTVASAATLYLMRLCVVRDFTGALYPLSALITLCQAGNAVVLAAYFSKSKAENTVGGITYDAALGTEKISEPNSDISSIFDTV